MNLTERKRALKCAVKASRAVGRLLRQHQHSVKKINSEIQHDIKLELDVRSQKLIERMLVKAFPKVAVLGEEGVLGDQNADARWVVDPIDGTVNFTYGIPHACISIAMQIRKPENAIKSTHPDAAYETIVGVVYDPFCDELWTAIRGRPAYLNGRIIHVSKRAKLNEAILGMGFSKSEATLNKMLPVFTAMVHRCRKIRLMGAAALAMTYTACGRFDMYTEYGLRLWDIAAGGLILECAGGEYWHEPIAGDHTYHLKANNGLLRQKVDRYS